MSDTIRENIPSIVPTEEILVEDEAHTYEQVVYDDGTTSEKEQYIPNKAPIIEFRNLEGIKYGDEYEFVQGVDYEIIDSDNDDKLDTIDWSIGGSSPDPDSEFLITYIAQSVIVRYVDSYQDEIERVESDIDNVIESRFVDEVSGTGIIDNFEDEDLAEWQPCTCPSGECFRPQTGVVHSGDWALEVSCLSQTTNALLRSDVGLNRYPKRGDTARYYTYLTNADNISVFDFALNTRETGSGESFYRVRLDAVNSEVAIQKDRSKTIGGDSVRVRTDSVDLDQYLNEWIEVFVEFGLDGEIGVRVQRGENEQRIAEVSLNDNEYDRGGIRVGARSDTAKSDIYFDDLEITDRNSGDLDRIGALFGELGKRRGRDDDSYRLYLKSIVQSFSGRGTVDGIEFAVASVLDVDQSVITVVENFSENTYNIRIPVNPTANPDGQQTFANSISTIYDIAQIADPSGVGFGGPLYDVGEDISESSVSSFERATVTNTRVLRWDSSDYDTFDWDSSTPGDLQEIEDAYTDVVEVNTSLLRRYDSGNNYDSFNWSGRSGTEITQTSDLVIEDVDADTATDDVDTSVVEAQVPEITQFINDTELAGVAVSESVTTELSDPTTLDDLSEESVTADAEAHTVNAADTVTTTVSELTFWNDSNWEDSDWTA